MKLLNRAVESLRQSDRNPRCYEMFDEERLEHICEIVLASGKH